MIGPVGQPEFGGGVVCCVGLVTIEEIVVGPVVTVVGPEVVVIGAVVVVVPETVGTVGTETVDDETVVGTVVVVVSPAIVLEVVVSSAIVVVMETVVDTSGVTGAVGTSIGALGMFKKHKKSGSVIGPHVKVFILN